MYLNDLAEAIRRAVPREALSEGDTSGLFRTYAVLLLAKGKQVTRADVHNAWVAWMADEDSSHQSLVPFGDLDAKTQAEDSPYLLAIRTVARSQEDHLHHDG
jgi:hypothetical protein